MRNKSAPLALFDMQPVLPLRNRCECLLRDALVPPVWGDQAHSGDALHRAHYVHTAADRPPALARLLHEAEALQPPPLGKRRSVTAEAPAVQLEPEQSQPVLE